MARGYVLPTLEIPDDALLLFEHMVMKDPDRTVNWRYYFDVEGCYHSARNTQLWLTEPEQFDSEDPELTWNTPFSPTPDRCLTEEQLAELTDSIELVVFEDLKPSYTSVAFPFTSSPAVERWTLVDEDGPVTVVAEQGASPPPLADLQRLIGRLVAEAPRSVSP
ncbi:MAG: hypothetical protein MUF84_14610 [Anaerolineae bacterium]|jgi:hypothetical protein|nr:hypothetical protein [Anaerolineae bacterium]